MAWNVHPRRFALDRADLFDKLDDAKMATWVFLGAAVISLFCGGEFFAGVFSALGVFGSAQGFMVQRAIDRAEKEENAVNNGG